MYKIDWNKYLSEDRLRPSLSPKRGDDRRNCFESDFGRVVFSSAMRRMHDKTQVLPLTNGDSVHTRLTHSIEVMNIAHSLGINYCRSSEFLSLYENSFDLENKISAILCTAAFFHDIGNPPFGHFGEVVIQQYFKNLFSLQSGECKFSLSDSQKLDFTEFDGNAQGVRNVLKLCYKGDLNGLNLTFATLGAYLKYPNTGQKTKESIGQKKHGVYTSEAEQLKHIAQACHMDMRDGLVKRHPLSYLVEAADTICYSVMDIEDALQLKWLTLEEVFHDLSQSDGKLLPSVVEDVKNLIEDANKNKNDKIISLRVLLINHLVRVATTNFIENLKLIDEGKYNQELVENDYIAASLKEISQTHIISRPEVHQIELTGHSVITGLLDIFIGHITHKEEQYRSRLKSVFSKSALKTVIHEDTKVYASYLVQEQNDLAEFDLNSLSDYGKLRLIIDYISNMTDKYAVRLYQQLSGQRL